MIIKEKIKNIDINDKIFEELKLEYKDFNTWFNKLIENDEDCFITKNNDKLTSIMILKLNEKDSSQIPYKDNVLKIRTLKVEDKNKGIGTSYMNIIHDLAVSNNIKYIYYTCNKNNKEFINFTLKYNSKFYKEIKNEHIYLKELK